MFSISSIKRSAAERRVSGTSLAVVLPALRRTESILSIMSMLSILFLVLLLSGCHNTIDTDKTTYYNASGGIDRVVEKESKSEMPTTNKSVDMQSDVNAVSASVIDAKTGNFSPYLDLGFFKLKYVSYPVIPGQPYFICRKEYSTSWWNWISFFSTTKQDTKENVVAETTMWIGNIPEKGKRLSVTTKAGLGFRVSGEGFETDSIKVKIETQ